MILDLPSYVKDSIKESLVRALWGVEDPCERKEARKRASFQRSVRSG